MQSYESLAGQLDERAAAAGKRRLKSALTQLADLLRAIRRRNLPEEDFEPFLDEIEQALEGDVRTGALSTINTHLQSHLENEYGLVPPNHYRDQWMALGMSTFGLGMGVVFAIALDSMAYIGIGLPIGLAIGSAIGAQKDQEARRKGQVLQVEDRSNHDSE
jgi:hypothetical protein